MDATRERGRWLGRIVGGVAVLSALATLGACSGASTDSSSSKSDAAAGSAALAAELNDGPAIGAQTKPDRDIIYDGSLTIRVKDAEQAADEALAFNEEVNGYVGKQDSQLEGEREVMITLRVPADEFDAVMAKAAKLGTVQTRTVDSQDVTDQVVDLEGRLENAKASAERLRGLLDGAQAIENITRLEDQLTQRESEIEQIAGQVEVLQNQVTYASIELTLTEKDAPTVSEDLPGPLEALRAGAVTVLNVLLVVLAAVAFALPFLPFVALGWFGIRAWRRRHPKAEPKPFPPALNQPWIPGPPGSPGSTTAQPPPPPSPNPEPERAVVGDGGEPDA